jgi:prevent-host-death family protein
MRVKTAALKNNLSRYLRHVRETGEEIIVCDRDTPIARIVSAQPVEVADPEWEAHKVEMARITKKLGGSPIRVPEKRPPEIKWKKTSTRR